MGRGCWQEVGAELGLLWNNPRVPRGAAGMEQDFVMLHPFCL